MADLHFIPAREEVSLAITVEKHDRFVHYELDGELDARTAPALLSTIDWISPVLTGTVVLDCRKLHFIDGRGLTALVRARALLAEMGVSLTLAYPSATFIRILTATMLIDRFPLADPALLAALERR